MPVSKPSISLDPVDAVDPDTATACAMLGVAKESFYRLAKRQLITGYLFAALSHQPFLLLTTCLNTKLGFNKFNCLARRQGGSGEGAFSCQM